MERAAEKEPTIVGAISAVVIHMPPVAGTTFRLFRSTVKEVVAVAARAAAAKADRARRPMPSGTVPAGLATKLGINLRSQL